MPGADRRSSRSRIPLALGIALAGAAAAMWWVPWTGYDSRCSLATRDDENIRGACAEGAAALMPWFVLLVVLGSAALLTAFTRAWKRRRSTDS